MITPTMLDKYNSDLPEEYFRDKIEGKKILVMGSGPSVDLRNWSNLDFDYIATVSFWYNREDLLNRSDIFFTFYSDLVDLSNKNLINYLDTHDVTIGFTEADPPFYKSSEFKDFKDKYKSRYVDFRVKFRKDEKYMGTAGRLLYFILNYNPHTLYYVGIDGVSNTPEKDPTNSFRFGYGSDIVLGRAGSKNQVNIKNSFLLMAETLHLESKSRGISLYNLGEGLPFNMSGEYSKIHYPLNQEIIKLIEK
jgi:hypothetical protein